MNMVNRMNVNIKSVNPALESLFKDSKQVVFLDANFFIVPDRSNIGAKPIAFQKYREYWLDPLFDAFSNLSVHESVYDELVEGAVKAFADEKKGEIPTKLRVYKDSELTASEQNLKLVPFSGYIPERDNAKDRGEIRSLAYMAVKQYLYFAANDTLPMQLICNAGQLETGLDDMGLLQSYEILYYLYKMGKYDSKGLKMLYKYQYYLTSREKTQNPDWGSFIASMDELYTKMESTG